MQEAPERERVQGDPCPTCGAPAERGQFVCLECGSRIALSYRRPPSWKIPIAIVAVLGALAIAGAVVAYDAIDDEASKEVAATPLKPRETSDAKSAKDSTTPAKERTTTSGASADAKEKAAAERKAAGQKKAAADKKAAAKRKAAKPKATAPATGTTSPEGLVRKGKLYSWPRDLGAFTVIVLSSEDRASATAFANSAADARAAKVGVIRSDDFETLPTGFFVVFAGSYKSRRRADRAAARLGGRYNGAFTQLVKR